MTMSLVAGPDTYEVNELSSLQESSILTMERSASDVKAKLVSSGSEPFNFDWTV